LDEERRGRRALVGLQAPLADKVFAGMGCLTVGGKTAETDVRVKDAAILK
jgi:hypothetical protein